MFFFWGMLGTAPICLVLNDLRLFEESNAKCPCESVIVGGSQVVNWVDLDRAIRIIVHTILDYLRKRQRNGRNFSVLS